MKILITGGTGFLAEALIERLYPADIRVVARNEGKLVSLKQKYPDIEIITGDIANEWIAKQAMKGVDEVYHLAAMKHVGIAEKQPFECIQSNIIGTQNLLVESLNERPSVFLMVSTDKAAQVNGVYGATKFLGERLVKEAELMNQETEYRVVRYGNVLYSTGSVLCKWKDNMLKGKEVIMTDGGASRFFWTRDEAVDLIFECIKHAQDSTPYTPKMKSMFMSDILSAMMEKYGKVKVKEIGLQPGENKHETMGQVNEMGDLVYSNRVPTFTKEEIMEKI